MNFTLSFQLDKTGHARWAPSPDDIAITHVGCKPGEGWQVWSDERQEHGDAGQLVLRVQGRQMAEFSLIHLDFFWPQLHELKLPLSVNRMDTVEILGPPGSIVTFAGLDKRSVR